MSISHDPLSIDGQSHALPSHFAQSARLHSLLSAALASAVDLHAFDSLSEQERGEMVHIEQHIQAMLDHVNGLFATPETPPEPIRLERAVVLVVEDEPDTNRFISKTLATEFTVISAFDGIDGLSKAVTVLPDLILSDLMIDRKSTRLN